MLAILALILALTATAPAPIWETLPACPKEDSANCIWDAQARGNGLGTSFYDLNGTAYPIPAS